MQEELQVELVHVAACVAGARRIQAHGAERIGKTAIDALDRIERKLALRQIRIGQIGQRRIALQIGQDDRRLDLGKNALEQRVEDALRVLKLRARQKHRIAGDIGDEKKAVLRHSRYSQKPKGLRREIRPLLAESCGPRAGECEAFPSVPCPVGADGSPSLPLKNTKSNK